MFIIGDRVILKKKNEMRYDIASRFLGRSFLITNIEDNWYYLNGGEFKIIKDVFESSFELFHNVDAMDAIIYGITSQMQNEKGPSVECPREIKCLPLELIKNEIPTYEDYNFNKKENNMEEILQIYKEKQTKLIEHKYDKQLEELENNDELQVYLNQIEETVKNLIGLEDDEKIKIQVIKPSRGSIPIEFTEKTIQRKEEIIKLIREKVTELTNKIIEIQALLELAPNYEEKIRILRDYEIIDKKKNIIL